MGAKTKVPSLQVGVDGQLVERALLALLKHHEFSSSDKTSLLGNDLDVQVQFSLARIPGNPSPKPVRIEIPHPLVKVDAPEGAAGEGDDDSHLQDVDACLIVKEESKPWVQDLVARFPADLKCIKKVLGLQSLRTKHGSFAQRRELLDRFDVFFADDRILPMLTRALGGKFFQKKKQPIPVRLSRKEALPFAIRKCLRSTYMYLSAGTCLSVKAGDTAMPPKKLISNIRAICATVPTKVPRKWSNVCSISIKTTASVALPIYNKSPTELEQIMELAKKEKLVAVEGGETGKHDNSGKKRKMAPTAAKSDLAKALKKQQISEAKEMGRAGEVTQKPKKSRDKKRNISIDKTQEDTPVAKQTLQMKSNAEAKEAKSEDEEVAKSPKRSVNKVMKESSHKTQGDKTVTEQASKKQIDAKAKRTETGQYEEVAEKLSRSAKKKRKQKESIHETQEDKTAVQHALNKQSDRAAKEAKKEQEVTKKLDKSAKKKRKDSIDKTQEKKAVAEQAPKKQSDAEAKEVRKGYEEEIAKKPNRSAKKKRTKSIGKMQEDQAVAEQAPQATKKQIVPVAQETEKGQDEEVAKKLNKSAKKRRKKKESIDDTQKDKTVAVWTLKEQSDAKAPVIVEGKDGEVTKKQKKKRKQSINTEEEKRMTEHALKRESDAEAKDTENGRNDKVTNKLKKSAPEKRQERRGPEKQSNAESKGTEKGQDEEATKKTNKPSQKKRNESIDKTQDEAVTVLSKKKKEATIDSAIDKVENNAVLTKVPVKTPSSKKKREEHVDSSNDGKEEPVVTGAKTQSSKKRKEKTAGDRDTTAASSSKTNQDKVVTEAATKENSNFIPAIKFNGPKGGYVFRKSKLGIGYYKDVLPVVDKALLASIGKKANRASRKSMGRPTKKKKAGRRSY